MDPGQVAAAFYRQQARLAKLAAAEAAKLWRGMDPARLDASFDSFADRLFYLMTGVQFAAASAADPYTTAVLAAQDLDPEAMGALVPQSLAGVASDGRDLGSLLYEPVIATKAAIGAGATTDRALATGLANLDMIVRTQTADAGRVGTGVSLTARPHADGYRRMVVGRTCPRCIILAGRFYQWNQGFDRHPRCDCIHIPASEDTAEAVATDPAKIFAAMSPAERDKVFGKAAAQAIRDGADMSQVVNARRGVYTAGGRLLTREGTTARGLHGGYFVNEQGKLVRRDRVKISRKDRKAGKKAPGQQRLMPEEIYRQSGGDRDKALSLLRDNGYITDPQLRRSIQSRAQLRASGFNDRAQAAASGDAARAAAPLSLLRESAVRGGRALRPDEAFALSTYKGSGFSRVNPWLRERRPGDRPDLAREVADIDDAMARSALTTDIVVHRGITDPASVFGRASEANMTGAVWDELAYVSTSTAAGPARNFALFAADGEAAVMRILVPKGTGAVELSNGDYEAELLLQRGLLMRIVADSGPGTRPRMFDVEVLPR